MFSGLKEFLRGLVSCICRFFPKRNIAVVYGWPDFEDNALALERGLNQTGLSKVVLLVTGIPVNPGFSLGAKTRLVRKNSLKGAWCFLSARYVFFTHRCFIFRFPANVVSVNVWHGMPIKKIGWLLEGNRGYDSKYALATSDFWAEVVHKSLRPLDKTLVTGLPRNDQLFAGGEDYWERLGLAAKIASNKVIGWLPTYRKSVIGEIRVDGRESENVFGLAGVSAEQLNERLREWGGFAIVKPHPMAKPAGHCQLSNLLIIDDAWLSRRATSLYELLGKCDLLATDMSSVAVDYLILDRPLIHLIGDLSAYRASRGFSIEPVEDYLAGPLVTDAEELFVELEKLLRGLDFHRNRRQAIRKIFHQQPDGYATARILSSLQLLPAATEPASKLDPKRFAAPPQPIPAEWHQTQRIYPRDQCIHEVFEAQAAKTPEAIAVEFAGRQLTYRELNQQANQIARRLQQTGVSQNRIVGLLTGRSLELPGLLLGILKAGGVYCSLDENLPDERLRWLVEDAGMTIIIVPASSLPRINDRMGANLSGQKTIVAVESLCFPAAGAETFHSPAGQAEMPAYVCYTSGSTGSPKGVLVPHRGVVRLVKGVDYVSLTPDETLIHHSPLSFDASTFEIWGALLNGGKLAVMRPGSYSIADIGNAIRQHNVTTLWLTAGLFHLMVQERLNDLKPLRQLLAGGDILLPQVVALAGRELTNCRLINGYGPTENTTFTCCYTVSAASEVPASVPIGRPISNTQVYVLDASRHPVPVGVPGELYVGGDGLAIGYLNNPELTLEKFIPSPFEKHTRLYRTGDLVCWRPDGNLEFLGRQDHQVKIRGYRIELGEVESVLSHHPAVAACALTVQHSENGGKMLAAYIVARQSEVITANSLRSWLHQKLPDYMVPSRLFRIEELPLNTNGKIDRKILNESPASEITDGAEYCPPTNDLQQMLARLWEKLLRREKISVQDNFFDLGGDSLCAVQMTCEVEKLMGVELPMATLFQSPTVESLARRLSEINWRPRWRSIVPLKTQGNKPPVFLVHSVRGEVYRYLSLVYRLPTNQPCYGIQAVGLDGLENRHTSIEEMAAFYVKELMEFQPSGAFYLAGYSMGGWIAYEVAQQLHRRGRTVQMLALLDSGPAGKVGFWDFVDQMRVFIPRRLVFHLRQWLRLSKQEKFSYLQRRWRSFQDLISQNKCQSPSITASPQKSAKPPKVSADFIDYYHAVAASYQLQPYPGSVEIFVGDQYLPGWQRYWQHKIRGNVSMHHIPGQHFEIFHEPNARVLADRFAMVLRRAQNQEDHQLSAPCFGPQNDRYTK